MAFDVDDEQKQQNFQHDDFVSQSLRKRNEADGDLPASFCCLIASLLPLPLFLLYGGKWEDINEEKVMSPAEVANQKKTKITLLIQIQLHESNPQKNEAETRE
ncbi:uncharacterized protein LOC113313334 isoform X2 [Papaver somniferum]|uniref:uncharacterized protein LOC113313334 isoform X2 n=1 Tax=Papaver somniferum TaxID=3469 RepID=UPI000E6F8F38|nr:uncharacterized protein LOC113313334 isoform X2 [Papaver somniferum]